MAEVAEPEEDAYASLTPEKQRLIDRAFTAYRKHAAEHAPALQLDATQERWLKILLSASLPEPGPAVVDRGEPCTLASIAELRELGVLLEVNRQFFHPLGLALETVRHDASDEDAAPLLYLHAIWDSRDDPEGIAYSDDPEYWASQRQKRERFLAFQRARHASRKKTLGYVVQPPTDREDG